MAFCFSSTVVLPDVICWKLRLTLGLSILPLTRMGRAWLSALPLKRMSSVISLLARLSLPLLVMVAAGQVNAAWALWLLMPFWMLASSTKWLNGMAVASASGVLLPMPASRLRMRLKLMPDHSPSLISSFTLPLRLASISSGLLPCAVRANSAVPLPLMRLCWNKSCSMGWICTPSAFWWSW